jgi:hypothetical protein
MTEASSPRGAPEGKKKDLGRVLGSKRRVLLLGSVFSSGNS